jgi:hypothetical protein
MVAESIAATVGSAWAGAYRARAPDGVGPAHAHGAPARLPCGPEPWAARRRRG